MPIVTAILVQKSGMVLVYKPHFWPENALLITILERFRKYKAQNNQGAMYAFHRHHN
jgi:hypothetical protein